MFAPPQRRMKGDGIEKGKHAAPPRNTARQGSTAMMTTGRRALVALAVLAAAPAAAQVPAAPSAAPADTAGARMLRPFQRLLQRRAELGLSDAQVRRLQEIQHGLEARNAPLRQRLASERQRWVAERRAQLEAMAPEQRRAEMRRMRRAREVPDALRPMMAEIRQNLAAAARDARQVLTPEQRQRVGRMLREQRVERRGAGARTLRARTRRTRASRAAECECAAAPAARP
jgi:Spy/CpxP family protein refolding chaperone